MDGASALKMEANQVLNPITKNLLWSAGTTKVGCKKAKNDWLSI